MGACNGEIQPAVGMAAIDKPLPAHWARSLKKGIGPVHWTEPRGIEIDVRRTEQRSDCSHALWTKRCQHVSRLIKR